MKTLVFILLFNSTLEAKVVAPYIKKNGKIVQGHLKSKPNKTKVDNYSYPKKKNP